MKNFDCSVAKTVEKIRELVAVLEASANMTSDKLTNEVSAFKDQWIYEDFWMHAKFYENDLDSGIEIDMQDMLISFGKKYENLVKQNEWNPLKTFDRLKVCGNHWCWHF